MSNHKSLFIVVEGPNGAGKTTFIDVLFNKLKTYSDKVVKTKQPFSMEIYNIVNHSMQCKEVKPIPKEHFSNKALGFLIMADRIYMEDNYLKPMLDQGYIVLCDRYALSTLIYQEELGSDILEKFTPRIPDLVIYLNVSAEVMLKRLQTRPGSYITKARSLELLEKYNHWMSESHTLPACLVGSTTWKLNADLSIDQLVEKTIDQMIDMEMLCQQYQPL